MRLDTDEHGGIILEEVYSSVIFKTEEGNKYAICMRDDTIEITPLGDAPAPRVYGAEVTDAVEKLYKARRVKKHACVECKIIDYAFNMHFTEPDGLIPGGWRCCEHWKHRYDNA